MFAHLLLFRRTEGAADAPATVSSRGSLHIRGPDRQPGRPDRTAVAPRPKANYKYVHSPLEMFSVEKKNKISAKLRTTIIQKIED